MCDIEKNIRDLRIQAGLSQEQLAERLYVTRQTISNYENGRTRPDVDQILRIAEVFGTDANTVLYGLPVPEGRKSANIRTAVGAGLTVVLGAAYCWVAPLVKNYQRATYDPCYVTVPAAVLRPLLLLLVGWMLVQALSMAMPVKAPQKPWARRLRWGVLAVTLCGLLLPSIPYALLLFNVKLLYVLPDFLQSFLRETVLAIVNYPYVYPLLGAALRLLDFPTERPAVRKSFTKLFR